MEVKKCFGKQWERAECYRCGSREVCARYTVALRELAEAQSKITLATDSLMGAMRVIASEMDERRKNG